MNSVVPKKELDTLLAQIEYLDCDDGVTVPAELLRKLIKEVKVLRFKTSHRLKSKSFMEKLKQKVNDDTSV